MQLLATEQGGSRTEPPLDYRVPLQLDDDRSRAFDGRLRFQVAPEPGGAAQQAELSLLDPDRAAERMKPGRVLTLWEGRPVGTLRVLG